MQPFTTSAASSSMRLRHSFSIIPISLNELLAPGPSIPTLLAFNSRSSCRRTISLVSPSRYMNRLVETVLAPLWSESMSASSDLRGGLSERREFSIRRPIGQEPLLYNLQAVVKFNMIYINQKQCKLVPWSLVTLIHWQFGTASPVPA